MTILRPRVGAVEDIKNLLLNVNYTFKPTHIIDSGEASSCAISNRTVIISPLIRSARELRFSVLYHITLQLDVYALSQKETEKIADDIVDTIFAINQNRFSPDFDTIDYIYPSQLSDLPTLREHDFYRKIIRIGLRTKA